MGALAEISSTQCWEQLQKDTRAVDTSAADTNVLIDVRTRAEWAFVGVPDLSSLGKDVLFIEWQHFGAKLPDPDFVSSLTALLGKDRSSGSLFFYAALASARAPPPPPPRPLWRSKVLLKVLLIFSTSLTGLKAD